MEMLRHECGVALLRLFKSPEYYREKYGSASYGPDKLRLLMQKQFNRGQEGAGVGCLLQSTGPDSFYCRRAAGHEAISDVFRSAFPPESQCLMGHLRYSTTGRSGPEYVHPFLRKSTDPSKSMMICGNFNLTNTLEIFADLLPPEADSDKVADTLLLLEKLGREFDKSSGSEADFIDILRRETPKWDGGFVICGIMGNGTMWALRDSRAIRPAFFYTDENLAVVASERSAIQTVFGADVALIRELPPGQCLYISPSGAISFHSILKPCEPRQCSFERIYFSRANDSDIYSERKALGRLLAPEVALAIDNDFDHTVFSYVPFSSETAYRGLTEALGQAFPSAAIRRDALLVKDLKLRTFITDSEHRARLASHIYDVTYGTVVAARDSLVVVDDSIVRGTTLRQSILRLLDGLGPRKIIIVSSAPQVRYPDFYGIDMSHLSDLIAFRAAMQLLKESGRDHIIRDVYIKCKAAVEAPGNPTENYLKELYAPFSDDEIAGKMAELLTPAGTRAEVKLIFQRLDNLRLAIPCHTGDWYFSGNYPTPGALRATLRQFVSSVVSRQT